jgi:uridine kinase
VSYASDVNELAINGKISEFIKINEMMQDDEITKIVKNILSKKNIKVILVGGPSSSGKTTTAKKIALKVKEYGKNPIVISLDDYYKERSETPKDEFGNYDFETIDALDIKLFNNQLKKLLEYKPVKMPTFNFITGEKEYKKPEIVLQKNDIIIIEGLHTLNEELTKKISRGVKYKIYVSPFTPLGMDRHNHISSTDLRLLRRIVRDNRTRGYNAEETIKRWKLMRNSEEKYVFPYQSEGDALINTALMYEINALRTYVEPLLYSISPDSDNYEEAKRIINFINNFFSIPDNAIPETSVLREFIGNSYFE